MTWLRRAWSWALDYLYVGWWQLRHAVTRSPGAEYARGERAPVLLLPGVYETWEFLRPVADIVNGLGHPVHVIRELGHNRGPVADMAALAQHYVTERGLRGVVILAHSKGGLIGKHMMVHDDTDARIDRMIAINTPFGGSVYARYALGRTLRAFSPRDRTLAMLGGRAEVNARITSIFAEFDPHIPGGSSLDGATNVRLPVSGHFRVVASRELLDEVLSSLEGSSG